MAGDMMKMLREIEVIHSTINPGADMAKLKLRYEEILNNYEIKSKIPDNLKDDMIENIKVYISSKKLEGLSSLTLEDYYRELIMFEYKMQKPTVQIKTTDIREYLASNPSNMASTTGKKLSVIKSFFAWLVDEEIILRNPAARIKQMKQPKRLPIALTSVELEMLRESCETLRERAMMEVMYSTGCRLSEIGNMKRADINWNDGSLSVVGKGNKERIVYLNPKANYHLKKYVNECEYADNHCEHLFSTERRPYRQIQNKSIQDVIERIAKRTDITKNVTPHTFRRTMATLAMNSGIELGDLQQLLGHENPSTTLRYAIVSEERKHNAHKRFVQ